MCNVLYTYLVILVTYSITPLSFTPETKNQWARDDPAFIVVETIFVGVSILPNYQSSQYQSCNARMCYHPYRWPHQLMLQHSKVTVFGDICGLQSTLQWSIGYSLAALSRPFAGTYLCIFTSYLTSSNPDSCLCMIMYAHVRS